MAGRRSTKPTHRKSPPAPVARRWPAWSFAVAGVGVLGIAAVAVVAVRGGAFTLSTPAGTLRHAADRQAGAPSPLIDADNSTRMSFENVVIRAPQQAISARNASGMSFKDSEVTSSAAR